MDAVTARKRFTPTRVVPKPDTEVPTVYSVEPVYQQIANLRVSSGRFYTGEEAARAAPVCVLGEAARWRLFGDTDPLGKFVKVNEQWFEVIGVVGPQAVAQGEVGGIGIMNIMLASVMERTPEIGLRRAIGATRVDIVRQFVLETTMIAVAGGAIGLALGLAMSRGIASFAGWSTIVTGWSLLLAFLVSVVVGLVSGVYPAMKAAELDPVQALHYE